MAAAVDTSAAVLQPQSLAKLRYAAAKDPVATTRAAAQQFESMFVGIMLKSMRAATPSDGPFDNQHSRMYMELMDQQVAQKIATTGKGLGLADMLAAQIRRGTEGATPLAPQDGQPIPLKRETAAIPYKHEAAPVPFKANLPGSDMMPLNANVTPQAAAGAPKDFVAAVWTHATEAAQTLGVAPHALVAQAALESGWGKREILLADGSTSHNLFGIKAGPEWQGKVAEVRTTEYVNGAPRAQTARFRAYDSYEEAFRDYVDMLKQSPRYAEAVQAKEPGQFALALQRAGYATDPAYADKLNRIMASATLRQAPAA
jgi:flagellar protein FlgJ